jgi:hypothetical protein
VILVDTSIWIDHLNHGDPVLSWLLSENNVLLHPYVFGELALGSLRQRGVILHSVRRLPEMRPARDSEVLALIGKAGLAGSGIGYVDAHLLTAVRLMFGASLWTRDRRLREAAEALGLDAEPRIP